MTDRARLPEPLQAVRALPPGAAVIFRDYDAPDRWQRAAALAAFCRQRGLKFLVAGDLALARRVRADGIHWPEGLLPARATAPRARGLVTAAAHDARAIRRAGLARVDAILLSPVFPTASPDRMRALGPVRFASLVRQSTVPVYALGGVNDQTARRLAGTGAIGIAAIDALRA